MMICRAAAVNTFRVSFQVKVHVSFGESVAVVGSTKGLGHWNITNAIPLKWTPGDVWVANCNLVEKEEVEYKYIKLKANGGLQEWMPGKNLVIDLAGDDVSLEDSWETGLITHCEDEVPSEDDGTIPGIITSGPKDVPPTVGTTPTPTPIPKPTPITLTMPPPPKVTISAPPKVTISAPPTIARVDESDPKPPKPEAPDSVEDGNDRITSQPSGKKLDIGGPLNAPAVAYGEEHNSILSNFVGSAVLVPKFPSLK